MNLRQIIRESINEFILDNIISEAIISEAPKGVMRRYANNKRQPQYQNFKQYKKQKNYNNRQQPTTQNKRGTNPYSTSTTAQGKTPYATNAQTQGQGTAQPQGQQTQTQQQTAQGQGGTTQGQGTAQPQGQQTQTQQQTAQGQGAAQQQQQAQQQTASIFKPFLDELKSLVGNRGVNPKPVENNQAAVQHIDKLNSFVFNVIGAIESGNINSANSPAAGNNPYNSYNPYGRDGIDAARDISKNAVNYLGNGAENILGQGTDNPLKGVFNAGVKGYNDTNNFFTQQINNRRYADVYNNSRTPNGSGNLTYLMQSINEGCYPRLQTEYHQIDQQNNGIFNATPNVSQCYETLQRLAVAVTTYNNSQKQQQGQQAQSQNTAPSNGVVTTGGGNTSAGTSTQPTTGSNTAPTTPQNADDSEDNTNEKVYYDSIADKLDVLQQECHNISLSKKIDENVANAAGWLANLSKSVVEANDNNNIQLLNKLLSLDGKEHDDIPTYRAVKEIFDAEYNMYKDYPGYKGIMQTMNKAIINLSEYRKQLEKNNNNR